MANPVKFFTDINLNRNQLKSAAIETATSNPSTPVTGQIYYNTSGSGTSNKRLHVYDGSNFVSVPYAGSIINADITNSTIQIGKIDTSSVRLDTVGTATNSIGFGNQAQTSVGSIALTTSGGATGRVTNIEDPVGDKDAANKRYVDAAISGVNVHGPTFVATTGVLGTPSSAYTAGSGGSGIGSYLTVPASSSTLSIDGETLNSSDIGKRILVKDQGVSYLYQNGIYTLDSFPTTSTAKLVRAFDYDGSVSGEVSEGDYILVTNGTLNAGKAYVQTYTGTIVVGSNDITFTQFSSAVSYTAGNGLQLGGTGGTEFSIDTNTTVDKTTAQSLSNKTISGSSNTLSNIGNSSLTNSTISGISLGSNLNALTITNGLSGTSYNGSSAVSIGLNTVSQTNTSGTAGTSFVQSISVDSYGRVTGAVTASVQDATTSVKGIASFSSNYFSITSGAISIDSTKVATLSASDTLASGVTKSSLTTVGTIGTGVWNGTDIAVADGGTGASTAASARSNLAAGSSSSSSASGVLATKYSTAIQNNTSSPITVTHNLGTTDVIVQVYETSGSPGTTATNLVFADVAITSTSAVTVSFASQDSAYYRVVVTG